MNYIYVSLASLVVGFIAGALVFRKNASKVEGVKVAIDKAISDVKNV